MMQPLIGITCCVDRGKKLRPGRDYAYVARDYATAVAKAGALPVLLDTQAIPDELATRLDGLVISGGDDLPTRLNGKGTAPSQFVEDTERTVWTRGVIDAFVAENKPMLGVCYGMQLINLHFGGSLLARLPVADENEDAFDHGGGTVSTTHGLELRDKGGEWLAKLDHETEVSSCHRQAVDEVAPGFRVAALAPDNVIEAIERDQILGVEWHPETDETASLVYGELVRRCA